MYNFDKIYNNNSEISACILNDKIENYIVTGCVDKDSETIKIFNLRGNKTKEIMVNNYVYYITSYFYKKLSQLFIIVGSYNCIKTFDFENDKEFNSYYSSEIKSNNRYYGVIVNNKDEITQLIASSDEGNVVLWNFETRNIIKIIAISSWSFNAICLWNNDILCVGWGDKSIKFLDLKNFNISKTLFSHRNNVITIKIIHHEIYGDFILSQDKSEFLEKRNSQIKLWGNGKKWI